MFVFRINLVCNFRHSDWIRTRTTLNMDTFHAVICLNLWNEVKSFVGQTIIKSSIKKWNRWWNLSKLETQGYVQLVTTKMWENLVSITPQIKNRAFTQRKESNCTLGHTSQLFISMVSKFTIEQNLLCI